jgi:hypothetical protein
MTAWSVNAKGGGWWYAHVVEMPGCPFVRKAYTKYPAEAWTLRKVLRRFLSHEREHIWTMERTLGEPRTG